MPARGHRRYAESPCLRYPLSSTLSSLPPIFAFILLTFALTRAPFQILAFPFIIEHGAPLYALFRRSAGTGGYWQGIAGGGEGDETPLAAARRESMEEAGIDPGSPYLPLDAMAMLPVVSVCGFLWGDDLLVIPEHAFGVEVASRALILSSEHQEYAWHRFEEAMGMLKWDSNRTALWELDHRLRRRSHPAP